MKTQIIQLNQNDDTISVRDQMNWSQAGRILLIYPQHVTGLTHQFELTLIKRHAKSLGAQLALVTQDPQVQFSAGQASIPVFDTLQLANSSSWVDTADENVKIWRVKNRPNLEELREYIHNWNRERYERPFVRIASFSLALMAVLAMAIYLLYMRMQVSLVGLP